MRAGVHGVCGPRDPDPCPATPTLLNAAAREGPGFLGRPAGWVQPCRGVEPPRPALWRACRGSPAEPRRPPPPPSAPLLPAPLCGGVAVARGAGLGVERAMLAPARPQLAHPTAAHTAARPPSSSRPPRCSLLEALGASPSLRRGSCTPYRPFRGGGGKEGLPSPSTAAPSTPPTRLPLRAVPSLPFHSGRRLIFSSGDFSYKAL